MSLLQHAPFWQPLVLEGGAFLRLLLCTFDHLEIHPSAPHTLPSPAPQRHSSPSEERGCAEHDGRFQSKGKLGMESPGVKIEGPHLRIFGCER